MFASGVEQTTTTTGTGNLTLAASPPAGRVTINSIFSNDTTDAGIYFQYHVVHKTANEWESGIGHLSASGTMVRDWVEANHSGGTSSVSFTAGTKYVRAAPIGRGVLPCLPAVQSTVEVDARVIPSGKQYWPTARATTITGDIYYVPYFNEYVGSVNAVTLITNTGAVGGNVICGIYTYSPLTGLPGRKITTGAQVAAGDIFTHSTFSARTLPLGWYFIAISMDATAAARSFESISPSSANLYGPLGAGSAGEPILALTESRVYAATLPTTATPTVGIGPSAGIAPVPFLRAA